MKNILMIGLGRFGRHMSKKFIEEGNEVFAVEYDDDRANSAVDYIRNIQIGDASDEKFISSIGVENFDICVVAVGQDFQTVLEIVVLLKDYGAKFIIARASRDVHQKLLLRNGADHVVYSEREAAERLAIKYGAKNIFDYVELTEDIGIYEIAMPKGWAGKSIIDLNIRARYNVNIMATKYCGVMNPMPSPKYIFKDNETVMIMGTEEDVKILTN